MAENDKHPADPTALTTSLVERAIAGILAVLNARLDGMDAINAEKFKGVDAAIHAARAAVESQTEASEKAIGKSEAATTKQIDALAAQGSATLDGMKDQIQDLKLNVERITAVKIGGVDQRSEMRDRSTDQRALIALGITIVLFVVTIIGFVLAITQPGG